jgi:hypothetical protein
VTGLLAALVVVAGGIAALLLAGQGFWFQVSCPGCFLAARADLRTNPGGHLVLDPAGATAVSPSRSHGSGKLPLPGRAR